MALVVEKTNDLESGHPVLCTLLRFLFCLMYSQQRAYTANANVTCRLFQEVILHYDCTYFYA